MEEYPMNNDDIEMIGEVHPLEMPQMDFLGNAADDIFGNDLEEMASDIKAGQLPKKANNKKQVQYIR